VNDLSLYPSLFSSPPRPTLHLPRERHTPIVALVLVFGLIPALTFAVLFGVAAANGWNSLGFALPPGAFALWHLLLVYGTWHNRRWARRMARVWVRFSFHLTVMAAIALAPVGPIGIGVGLVLLLVVAVAAAIALAARR